MYFIETDTLDETGAAVSGVISHSEVIEDEAHGIFLPEVDSDEDDEPDYEGRMDDSDEDFYMSDHAASEWERGYFGSECF